MTPNPRPTRRRRLIRLIVVLALSLAVGAWRFWPQPYDPRTGLAAYGALRHHISGLYANLDWSAERGGIDLRELHAQTFHALAYARSEDQARDILRGFVRAFDDPHMTLHPWEAPSLDSPRPAEALTRSTPPEKACTILGYTGGTDGFAFALDEKLGFRPFGRGGSFPAALLDADGRRFGFLRIGSFVELDYRGACLSEWQRFSQPLPGTCEGVCRRDFMVAVAGRLVRELAWEIRGLREAGASVLVIDVTGNHGGHGWHRSVQQMLTSRPVPPFRIGLVKGEYTADSLREERQIVFHYAATHIHDLPPRERAVLDEALCRLDDVIAEAEHPCSANVWAGEPGRLPCPRLTTRPLFSSGLFAEDPFSVSSSDSAKEGPVLRSLGEGGPGVDIPFSVAQIVNQDHAYPRLPAAWTGPLAILVDGGTGSAAELFAASLRFSAGAVILGRHTASSGGGWTFGRDAWPLSGSRLNLYLPDSVQYYPDGTNAREGVEPDYRILTRPRKHPELTAKWLATTLSRIGFAPPS